MKPILSTSLAYLAGLALAAAPVLLAISVAQRHSVDLESQRAMALAVDQLAREPMAFLVPIGLLVGLAMATGFYFVVWRQVSLPSMLRAALRRNEFSLVYQPILRLDTRQCVGAEALLRWRRRDGRKIGPDLFIPVAEQSGIITSITRRILALIEREVPALVRAFPQLHVSVNLSSRDLQTPDIVKRLTDLVHRSGITPKAWRAKRRRPSCASAGCSSRKVFCMRSRCRTPILPSTCRPKRRNGTTRSPSAPRWMRHRRSPHDADQHA